MFTEVSKFFIFRQYVIKWQDSAGSSETFGESTKISRMVYHSNTTRVVNDTKSVFSRESIHQIVTSFL